jgi:hypothetical protein
MLERCKCGRGSEHGSEFTTERSSDIFAAYAVTTIARTRRNAANCGLARKARSRTIRAALCRERHQFFDPVRPYRSRPKGNWGVGVEKGAPKPAPSCTARSRRAPTGHGVFSDLEAFPVNASTRPKKEADERVERRRALANPHHPVRDVTTLAQTNRLSVAFWPRRRSGTRSRRRSSPAVVVGVQAGATDSGGRTPCTQPSYAGVCTTYAGVCTEKRAPIEEVQAGRWGGAGADFARTHRSQVLRTVFYVRMKLRRGSYW